MHGIAYVLGLTDAAGDWYLWWSGFFGNITIFAGVGAFIIHKNCHVQGCWRIGGHVGTCKKHRAAVSAGRELDRHAVSGPAPH